VTSTTTEIRVSPTGWDGVVADVEGPQLVVGGPGSGKTEFLVRRALRLIEHHGIAPDRILLLSFSRRGAADLRARIAAGLDRSTPVIPASTFHSLALRLLEAHGAERFGWPDAPTLLTKPEQVALVLDLLASEDRSAWPVLYRELLGTPGFANEVADFVLRCAERLIGPGELERRAAGRDDWRALPGFLDRYRRALGERHRLDYGTLQTAAVDLLEEPGLRHEVSDRFPYVLVDEYQDTTPAQVRLLAALAGDGGNLTAAGDPYQSVYSFRGAELENVASFPTSFPDSRGRPARRLVLTHSFRVPAGILQAAVRVTAGGDLPGAAGPVVPAPGTGSVETYGFDQHSHEAEWIAAEVQRVHLLEDLPYREMAVLVRSKRRFVAELSRALRRRGIPHDEPDDRLVDHPAVRTVLDAVRAAAGPDTDRAVRRLLLGPMGLTLSAVRRAERERAAGSPWPEVLRAVVPGGGPLAGLLEDPHWASTAPAAEGFWHLWTTLPVFAEAVADPRRRADRAAWASLSQVLEQLGDRDPAATLADYRAWSEAEDFEATPLLEFRPPDEDRLTVTTLHQAKGLSFEVLFIADAVDGVLPDLRSRDSLLGVRHLSERDAAPAAYARFRLQEEMRLGYTAMCRARRRVVWTATSAGFDEGGGMPGRFMALAAGVTTVAEAARPPAERPRPVTPLEAEAWLRRILADPAESAPRRLASLAALTAPGGRLPRRASEFAGVRRRGPDVGLLPPDLRLSPSQADAYLRCPRRYAIGRRLHVDGDRPVHLDFGTLVHAVLEEAEEQALADGLPNADPGRAVAALDRLWDSGAFGGPAWGGAWRARAERLLTHLYEHWPGRGPAVALERPVALRVGATEWRGRIDRIEQVGAPEPGLAIVDYKTAATAPTVEEASRSVQLGFYALAAAADPGLARLGPVVEAAFWYPAARAGRAKSVTVRRLDLDRLEDVTALMARAEEGIRAEDWRPAPGSHCERCPVRTVCPAWPEGREAYRS
jgi:superfamily I DNA/RNA helicase